MQKNNDEEMKYVQTLLLFLFSTMLVGQMPSPETNLIGKWAMVEHTLEENGKTIDKFNEDAQVAYEFNADGSYELRSSFKYNGKWNTVVTVGQWRISPDSTHVELFDNNFLPPHDTDGTCADHALVIVDLTSSVFVTEEYWFSEYPPGRSTYRKQ